MIGFFCSKKSSSAMALDAPVEAPQVGKGNAKVVVSLVGYDQELKDGRCAETDDILPDGFKLKRKMVFYYMSYAMGRGCLTFGEMMQKISDLKDYTMVFSNLNHRSNSSHFMYIYSLLFFFCLQKRLYMLIFISGKNKNENMEMERVIKFPHTHVDRRPRKRPRLGWDIAPQALKEGATKEDIERLPKYKFRRIGDFEKQNGEIQESFGGIITECDTDSPIEHVLSPENAECCICLCPYEDGTELRELPCRHHFHCSCIDKWLYINATCPLCKFNILKNGNQSSSEEV